MNYDDAVRLEELLRTKSEVEVFCAQFHERYEESEDAEEHAGIELEDRRQIVHKGYFGMVRAIRIYRSEFQVEVFWTRDCDPICQGGSYNLSGQLTYTALRGESIQEISTTEAETIYDSNGQQELPFKDTKHLVQPEFQWT